jgi:hypothetical protein
LSGIHLLLLQLTAMFTFIFLHLHIWWNYSTQADENTVFWGLKEWMYYGEMEELLTCMTRVIHSRKGRMTFIHSPDHYWDTTVHLPCHLEWQFRSL